ncbi:concanavalin A-like lectin/glucanase domain-containing protein [Xylariales sp. PMI_506]|nr:concanavalin A-like lectin/glucanase domain-containing protein [Xylariales sp. PMI_506]
MTSAHTYGLIDRYDYTNYLSKFNFYQGADPGNGGFVNYLSAADAVRSGLARTVGTEFRLGVDSINVSPSGRDSFRVESAETYKYGLFVGYFTHLPEPICGAWPAFWMYSYENGGEFDIAENWNDITYNRITLHTSSDYSTCMIGSTPVDYNDPLVATNCYSPDNIGCGVDEFDGYWGSSTGGTYALEWTPESITVWSWAAGREPGDLRAGNPAPATWANPHVRLTTETCGNLPYAFGDMTIIMNVDFCGNPVGRDDIWGQSCLPESGMSCNSFVASNPEAFANVYFEMSHLDIYQMTS